MSVQFFQNASELPVSTGASLAMFFSHYVPHYLKHLFLLAPQHLRKDRDGPATGSLADVHPGALQDKSLILAVLRPPNGSTLTVV